jgi:hypothetical protein
MHRSASGSRKDAEQMILYNTLRFCGKSTQARLKKLFELKTFDFYLLT